MALNRSRLIAAGLIGIATAATPGVGAAQQSGAADGRPWYVAAAKWGKWPTLAAAVGFTAAAIVRKDAANRRYDQLQALCLEDSDSCRAGPSGAYVSPDAEALYQETVRLDHQARRWMIGGQSFLFVSGGMFLIDLVAGKSKPKNIPFTPLEAYAAPGVLGLRWPF